MKIQLKVNKDTYQSEEVIMEITKSEEFKDSFVAISFDDSTKYALDPEELKRALEAFNKPTLASSAQD